MATLEERVAYVEGRLVLLPQMIAGLRDEMNARFDAVDKRFDAVDKRFDAVDKRFEAVDRRFDTMDMRFDRLEGRVDRVDGRIDRLDDKMSRQFLWLVGIQITTFISTLAAILGVLLERG